MSPADRFRAARDLLIRERIDYETAYREFRWPVLDRFNWALDWFDAEARGNDRLALWLVNDDGSEHKVSFAQMSERSNRVANLLRRLGVRRGDRLLVMLPNMVPIWEITLAAIKLGAVVSPATTLLTKQDLADRIARGQLRYVVADAARAPMLAEVAADCVRIVVGEPMPGWHAYADADRESAAFHADGETQADDPLLLYFTSGTTAKPKMVLHSHVSYPVGHLSTMYWIGLQPGDLHWNISSPGWAKHAWSCFFAPWNAGATVFIFEQARFDPKRTLETLARCGVTSLCAPPTVWRALILQDLKVYPVKLRELLSAGEPLNPEVIEHVRAEWGINIRDGYGQTETTCAIGNPPGQPLKPGSMGRAMPGYRVALIDLDGKEANEGEVGIALDPAPISLLRAYVGDEERTTRALGGAHYMTGDVASRDADGYFTFVGRTDDVFKSSDYRVSPFELESALLEHEAVAEAAVVPSPDPRRLAVPKAFIVLKPGVPPSADTARAIFGFLRERVAPYKRIRRLQFSELPKTVSGKIRRVELRNQESARGSDVAERAPAEFWEEDFPDLGGR
jgi:acetyl-CoA synthetase